MWQARATRERGCSHFGPRLALAARVSRLPVLFALALSACGAYQPGSFESTPALGRHEFRGERITRGCLDIALAAEYNTDAQDPALTVTLGNRCDHSLWVHLQRLAVVGTFDGGIGRRLSFYDPRQEIRSGLLEAHATASESFEVVGAHDARELCVSLERLADASSVGGPPPQLCIPVEGKPPVEEEAPAGEPEPEPLQEPRWAMVQL